MNNKKGMIGIIIVAVLVIGGGAAAFLFVGNKTLKEQYFLAESETIEQLGDLITDKFEDEIDWYENSLEKPIETKVELSAEYNDPAAEPIGGMFDVAELINNSTIEVITQNDMKEKVSSVNLNANVAGMAIEDFKIQLTDDKLSIDLPFLEEDIVLQDKDVVRLANEFNPETFAEGETIDFADFFEAQRELLSDKDKKYFEKEYGLMIYKEIPESAFKSTSETVEVNGEKVKTEKIDFTLTEQEVKDISLKIVEKLEKDNKAKSIFEDMYNQPSLGNLKDISADYDKSLVELKESIPNLKLPEGLLSTVWLKSDVVVKRDFNMIVGDKTEFTKVNITGDQNLDAKEKSLNYDFVIEDQDGLYAAKLKALLVTDGNKQSDEVVISAGFDKEVNDFELKYTANETADKGKHDFEREFVLSDDTQDMGKLFWEGKSVYEKDQMNSNHVFSVEAEGVSRDLFSLNADFTGKQIKTVDKLDSAKEKDLGSMSVEEINEYVEVHITNKFTEWLMGQM